MGLYGYGATHIIVFKDITVTIVPTILATVDVNPDTLNLKSNGECVTVYITLPDDQTSNIDPLTVELKGISVAFMGTLTLTATVLYQTATI